MDSPQKKKKKFNKNLDGQKSVNINGNFAITARCDCTYGIIWQIFGTLGNQWRPLKSMYVYTIYYIIYVLYTHIGVDISIHKRFDRQMKFFWSNFITSSCIHAAVCEHSIIYTISIVYIFFSEIVPMLYVPKYVNFTVQPIDESGKHCIRFFLNISRIILLCT